MNGSERYERAPTALWQRTSRRVLINARSDTDTFELAGVAALVWDALAEPVSVLELSDDLSAVFDQPVDEVREQVERLITDLVGAGAVRSAS